MPKPSLLGYGVRAVGIAILIAVVSQIIVARAEAATSTPTSGITVSPASLVVQVGSRQPESTTAIGIRNNYDVPIAISASLAGYDIRNNSLIPNSRQELKLADNVTITPAEIVVPPGGSKNVTVTVRDTTSLTPGGHYLSILITQVSEGQPTVTPQLALKPAVSASLYIIKEDGAVRSVAVTKFTVGNNIFSLPRAANVTFASKGNVVVVPRGVISLSQSGREGIVGQGIINQDSTPLYPASNTTLQTDITHLGTPKIPGKYKAVLQYRADGQLNVRTLKVQFWYIPPISVAIGLVAVLFIAILIWPRSRHQLVRALRRRRKSKTKAFVPPTVEQKAESSTSTSAAKNIDGIVVKVGPAKRKSFGPRQKG